MTIKDTTLGVSQAAENTENILPRDETINQIVLKAKIQRDQEEKIKQEDSEAQETTSKTKHIETDEKKPTIKVDGEIIEVTREEIEEAGSISILQKDRAASNRLREAADKNKKAAQQNQELAAREQLIAQREQALVQKSTEQLPNSDVNSIEPSEQAKKFVDDIYSGDEEIAALAVESILNVRRGEPATQVDTNVMTEQVTNKALFEIERQQANTDFILEYPEINKNYMLKKLANDETVRLSQEHPDWGPRKIIMEAGNVVQENFQNSFNQQKILNEDMERQNDKRATDNVTGASGRVPIKPEKARLTPAEIVQKMNEGRTTAQV